MGSIHRPVKVAILAGQLVVGGAERQLFLWLKHLDRNLYEPVVVTLHPNHNDFWEEPIRALNIPLISIPQQKNRLARLVKVIQTLRPYQPALIHGWHLFSSTYAGLAARVLRVKSIGSIRNAINSYREHKLESLITLFTVNGMVVNTKATSDYVRDKLFLRKIPIFTVQNCILDDFQDRSATRRNLAEKFGVSISIPWIVSIGRMDPLKRFDLLLESLVTLHTNPHKFHCFLIGDGPERKKLEGIANKLGLADSVTFTGELPQANTLLKAFDIFSFASTDEGMPNVLMEAAAAGLPILTWRYPFSEEILQDRISGIFIDPGDMRQFSESLQELIEHPDLRKKIGQEAHDHILRTFSLKKYLSSMQEAYETVLSDRIIRKKN